MHSLLRVLSTSIRFWVMKGGPTGMTIRPPGLSWLDQRRRDMARSRRHDDGVEGAVLGPTEIAVALAHARRCRSPVAQSLGRALGQRLDDLDRVDAVDEPREHGGLVADPVPISRTTSFLSGSARSVMSATM